MRADKKSVQHSKGGGTRRSSHLEGITEIYLEEFHLYVIHTLNCMSQTSDIKHSALTVHLFFPCHMSGT